MTQEIILKKSSKIEDSSIKMVGLEVEYEVDGQKKGMCFDDYDYWTQKVNGEERFKTRIKENENQIQTEPTKEVKITEENQYKEVKIQ